MRKRDHPPSENKRPRLSHAHLLLVGSGRTSILIYASDMRASVYTFNAVHYWCPHVQSRVRARCCGRTPGRKENPERKESRQGYTIKPSAEGFGDRCGRFDNKSWTSSSASRPRRPFPFDKTKRRKRKTHAHVDRPHERRRRRRRRDPFGTGHPHRRRRPIPPGWLPSSYSRSRRNHPDSSPGWDPPLSGGVEGGASSESGNTATTAMTRRRREHLHPAWLLRTARRASWNSFCPVVEPVESPDA